jgi:glucose-6-phosphate 1-epimerase
MDTIRLRNAGGETAEISTHGAQVLSWKAADGEERLYLSPKAVFAPEKAIRGGIPVIFPQFGPGVLLKHGFARLHPWQALSISSDEALLSLAENPATLGLWPHRFRLELQIRLRQRELYQQLTVLNTCSKAFAFTVGLHPYFAVPQATEAQVLGLRGMSFLDVADENTRHVDSASAVSFGPEIDRTYLDAPTETGVRLQPSGITVNQAGFRDVVVWNPGLVVSQDISDLPFPEGWEKFICVEPTQASQPIRLEPGQNWQGEARYTSL